MSPSDAATTEPSLLRQLLSWSLVVLEVALYALTATGLGHLIPREGFFDESLFRAPGSLRFVNETPRWLIASMGAHLALFLVVRVAFGWRAKELGLARPFSAWRENALLTSAGLVVVNAAMLAIPGITKMAWDAYHLGSREDLLIFLFWFAPVVAGLGEELTFRACLQGRAMEAHAAWGGVAAALTFALLHRFQGAVSLLGLHIPSALLFAVVYRQKRDLLAQIVGHALFDLVVFAELWFVHSEGRNPYLICGAVAFFAGGAVLALRPTMTTLRVEATALFRELAANKRAGIIALLVVPIFVWIYETEWALWSR